MVHDMLEVTLFV